MDHWRSKELLEHTYIAVGPFTAESQGRTGEAASYGLDSVHRGRVSRYERVAQDTGDPIFLVQRAMIMAGERLRP